MLNTVLLFVVLFYVYPMKFMYSLALLYQQGLGVEHDDTAAIGWLQKAAVVGNIAAYLALGDMYRDGLGVAQDYEMARTTYEKALALGNVPARIRLGLLYLDGLGVDSDRDKAKEYFQQAYAEGEPAGAFYMLQRCHHIASRLSRTDARAAQRQ